MVKILVCEDCKKLETFPLHSTYRNIIYGCAHAIADLEAEIQMVVASWAKDYAVTKDEKVNGTFITYHERTVFNEKKEEKKDNNPKEQVV